MTDRVSVSQTVLTLVMAVTASGAGQRRDADDRARIVFVCEHGAAKSVMAAAHFNKTAYVKRKG